jgi:glycosyltransferase involved in cell wall biosynthesis
MTKEIQEGLVSVIICVYNAGHHLRSSVESILNQSYHHLEILIVDDGSTDGCMNCISDLVDARIRIIRQTNKGKPAALNRALKEAKGEFYAVHDADDLSHRDRIYRQVACMRTYPKVAGVFCGFDLILNDHHIAPKFHVKDQAHCRRDIEMMHMPGHDPTAMYRRSLVEGMAYDEQLPIVEGFDYVLRVGEKYDMYVLGECLYSYRIHWDSVTKRDPSARMRLFQAAMRKVRLRRGLPVGENDLPPAAPSPRPRNKELDNDLVSHFMASMVDLRNSGRWTAAVKTAFNCLSLHPLDVYYYKPAAYAVAPRALISWHRARRGTV